MTQRDHRHPWGEAFRMMPGEIGKLRHTIELVPLAVQTTPKMREQMGMDEEGYQTMVRRCEEENPGCGEPLIVREEDGEVASGAVGLCWARTIDDGTLAEVGIRTGPATPLGAYRDHCEQRDLAVLAESDYRPYLTSSTPLRDALSALVEDAKDKLVDLWHDGLVTDKEHEAAKRQLDREAGHLMELVPDGATLESVAREARCYETVGQYAAVAITPEDVRRHVMETSWYGLFNLDPDGTIELRAGDLQEFMRQQMMGATNPGLTVVTADERRDNLSALAQRLRDCKNREFNDGMDVEYAIEEAIGYDGGSLDGLFDRLADLVGSSVTAQPERDDEVFCTIRWSRADIVDAIEKACGVRLDQVPGAPEEAEKIIDRVIDVVRNGLEDRSIETGWGVIDTLMPDDAIERAMEIAPEQVPDPREQSVRDWYVQDYPTDELGSRIRADVTFDEALGAVARGDGFYDAIGAGDSIVRERIFSELADRYGVGYDDIYEAWIAKRPVSLGEEEHATSEVPIVSYDSRAIGERLTLALYSDSYSHGGGLALGLVDATPGSEELGESWGLLTVNLPDQPEAASWCAQEGHVILDTNNNSPELVAAVAGAGLVRLTGETVRSGFCEYPLAEVTSDAMRALRGFDETVDEVIAETWNLRWGQEQERPKGGRRL